MMEEKEGGRDVANIQNSATPKYRISAFFLVYICDSGG